jgi:hypothetical protein
MFRQSLLGLIAILFLITGCTRGEKVQAIEGESISAYDSLGSIEVQVPACRFCISHPIWLMTKVFTLGFAGDSRADLYKKSLARKLAKKAKKDHHADAVIMVRYWPDPNLDSFPQGKVFARGEMVRYKTFPGDNATSQT